MNNLDLTHLETLLAAATPGPWEISGPERNWRWTVKDAKGNPMAWEADYYPEMFSRKDTETLVSLRNAAPALIARVRELEDRQVILEKAKLNASQIIASLANDDADLWQPIETAPKDGTRLLVAHASGEIYSAFYSDDFEEWMIVGNSTSRQLTHWKHLPKPPTE